MRNSTNITFGSVSSCPNDSFERGNKLTSIVYNPYKDCYCTMPKNIDLDKEQDIRLKSLDRKILVLHYKPNRTDYLYDKKSRKYTEVQVLWSENPKNNNEFSYHFFSKDLKQNYGYVTLNEYKTRTSRGIEEICVKTNDENIQNLNEIADKYAVQYCKRNGIEPNIIAYPKPENYRENYQSGKRFVQPELNSEQYNQLKKKYGIADPNKIIKNSITDTSKWPSMKMYLPAEKVEEYLSSYITEGFTILNPITDDGYCHVKDSIDITKPRKFDCYASEEGDFLPDCTIDFNPNRTGQIYDKVNNKPIDVFILKLHDNSYPFEDSFHFVSKDLKHEYGYVELDRDYKTYDYDFRKNYPNEDIIGERIVVEYLKNYNDENYGGIGKLADKIAVKYCMENKIKPNIFSIAGENSHIAHYSRGKRFIKPEKDSEEYNFLMYNYNTPNPNRALKELLLKSKRTGEDIDLSKWNEHYFYMYLPKHLVEKYKKEP